MIYLSSWLVGFLLQYRRSGLRRRAFFPGPMTDGNERREPATDERYRRDLDKNVHVSGPVTDSAISLAAERYRRDVRAFLIAEVTQGPALNAEGRISDDFDVRVVELDSKRIEHVGLVILNCPEAAPR